MCRLEKMVETKKDSTRRFVRNISIDSQSIPVWEVWDIYGFVKLLGHAKFINNKYGGILFRGQTKIYPTFRPSAYRRLNNKGANQHLEKMIDILVKDAGRDENSNCTIASFTNTKEREAFEAILQHYGFRTRMIDVVDNQWVALWFASHHRMTDNELCPNYKACKECYESERYIDSTEEFSYVYLLAIPEIESRTKACKGIEKDERHCLVDIRKACPSTILRPHMQHGLVVGYYDEKRNFSENYAQQLVGIVRIKTQTCLEWLNGDRTLNARTLFPCPNFDEMYKMILETRKDLFETLDQE